MAKLGAENEEGPGFDSSALVEDILHERTELVSSDTQRGPCAYLGIIAITYSGRIVEVAQIGELSACIGVIGPHRHLRVRTDRNAIFAVRIGGDLRRQIGRASCRERGGQYV